MRIVGGKYKGRIFHPGKSFRSRPTTDFAKESLFNILQNRIDWEETDALDLFAGTGSISFELASRGCRSVTSVEKDFVHFRFIKGVAEELGLEHYTAIRDDVFRFLWRPTGSWPLIFADPPYTLPGFESVVTRIMESEALQQGGLLIIEHSGSVDFSAVPGFFELRKYGHVHFSFLRKGTETV